MSTESTPRILGMRDAYFEALFPIFKEDPSCIIITADNGAPSLDQFARELPRQFIQVGIAEQQMFGMAAGLAFEGRRVWCYAIAPFVTTRVHEFVKLDVCAMNLPITILGVGAGYAYDIMGPSHHTVEDISMMRCLPNLEIWSPADPRCAVALAGHLYQRQKPAYVRFDRSGIPDLNDDNIMADLSRGWRYVGESKHWAEATIIATGIMVHQALKVSAIMRDRGEELAVVDLFRLKPANLDDLMANVSDIISLEEHFLAGGLGSMLSEWMVDNEHELRLLRIGRTEEQGYCFEYGGREVIWKNMGLDVESVTKRIGEWL